MASTLFGLNLPYWELWLPLLAGITVAAVSVAAFQWLGRRGQRPVELQVESKPAADPAPDPLPHPAPGPVRDPFVEGSATEQRRAFRRTGNPVTVLICRADDTSQVWHGRVRNRSVGGLAMVAECAFDPDTVLRV